MKVYAKDKKCCECGKQAETFWPCVDPDIKSYPYCKECLQKVQDEIMTELYEEG